jgi:hypothetical protein
VFQELSHLNATHDVFLVLVDCAFAYDLPAMSAGWVDMTDVETGQTRLVPRSGQWFVEDLGSTNGTYLDRAKVTAPTPVPLGVPIRIGRTSLELRP